MNILSPHHKEISVKQNHISAALVKYLIQQQQTMLRLHMNWMEWTIAITTYCMYMVAQKTTQFNL